ncbi:MAG: hypothetical protein DWQ01_06980 [Planctomycetota bacterium]|nr:MAG: hypothetical protein DWQ01_06980 [Planctomycetota bacterium]
MSSSRSSCLNAEAILEVARGPGGPAELAHLGECSRCREEFRFAALQLDLQSELRALEIENENPSEKEPCWEDLGLPAHFKYLELIGSGGQGRVFLFFDTLAERHVAVKMPIFGRSVGSKSMGRFLQETKLIGGMKHPSIVALYGAGISDTGVPYFCMEYIRGVDLGKFVENEDFEGKRRVERLVRIFCEICHGVHYAHRFGVIHRDIKPGNILVTPKDEVKILDFGIAKFSPAFRETGGSELTATGIFHGSFRWAAPEQIQDGGKACSAKSDQYSLGLLLYWMLSGKHWPAAQPWRNESGGGLLEAATRGGGGMSISRLRGIFGRALAEDPKHRFSDVAELARACESLLDPLPWRQRIEEASRLVAARWKVLGVILFFFFVLVLGSLFGPEFAKVGGKETSAPIFESENALWEKLDDCQRVELANGDSEIGELSADQLLTSWKLLERYLKNSTKATLYSGTTGRNFFSWSSEEDVVLVGSRDGEFIRLYNLSSRGEEKELQLPGLRDARIDSNGRRFGVISRDGFQLFRMDGRGGISKDWAVSFEDFLPSKFQFIEGGRVAVASSTGRILVCGEKGRVLADFQPEFEIELNRFLISGLPPDSPTSGWIDLAGRNFVLAILARGGGLYLWKESVLNQPKSFSNLGSGDLALVAEGQTLLVGAMRPWVIHLKDYSIQASLPGMTGSFRRNIWTSPDKRMIAVVDRGGEAAWAFSLDNPSQKWNFRTDGKQIRELQFSNDGKMLAGLIESGEIRFWQLEPKIGLLSLPLPAEFAWATVHDLSFSEGGRQFVAAHGMARVVTHWHENDSSDFELNRILHGRHLGYSDPRAIANDLDFRPGRSGEIVLSWNFGGIRRISASNGSKFSALPMNWIPAGREMHSSISEYSPSGKEIAAGVLAEFPWGKRPAGAEIVSKIMIWDVESGDVSLQLDVCEPLGCHSFSEEDYRLNEASKTPFRHRISNIRWIGNGEMICAALASGQLIYWNPKSGSNGVFQGSHQGGAIRSLATVSSKPVLISGGDDGVIRVWNLRDFSTKSIHQAHGFPIFALATSKSSRYLASGDTSGRILLWETMGWTQLAELKPKGEEGVFCLEFSPDGRFLAAGLQPGGIELFDFEAFATVLESNRPPRKAIGDRENGMSPTE